MTDPVSGLETLRGQVVVIDIEAPYVYVGTLADFDTHHFVLENADVHDPVSYTHLTLQTTPYV